MEHARRRNLKRGGAVHHLSLDETAVLARDRTDGLAELDNALADLARMDPRKAQVVEVQFFGGLSVEETAEGLRFRELP